MEEIDWRIDNLIRSPDSLMVARGIELREKRKAAKLEARQADNERPTIEETYRRLLKSWGPFGAPAFCEMWAAGTGKPTYLWGCPFLPQLLPVIGKRFPELLSKYRDFFKRRADAFPVVKWEQERLRLFDLWASSPEPSLEELAAALAKDGVGYSKGRAVD